MNTSYLPRLSGQVSWLLCILILSLSPLSAEATEPAGADTSIFAAEALLVPGQPVQQNVVLYLQNGRIIEVRPAIRAEDSLNEEPNTGKRIDLSCCFVVPGLIDTQTHLESQRDLPSRAVRMTTWSDADYVLRAMVHARRTLEAGFTTIRDMGSHGDYMFALRDAVNEGLVPGPRMQVAGQIIHPAGGEFRSRFTPEIEALFDKSAACNGADDCRRAVREQIARGSDTIKVGVFRDLRPGTPAQFSLTELQAIAEEAHRLGVRVTASSFSADSMNQPLKAGFDAVVHGTFVDPETLKLLRATSAYYIPTLVAARTVREMAEDPDLPFSQDWREENLLIYSGMTNSFQQVMQAGLPIAFGTDAGWRPHGGNAEQLVQMVELGMPSEQVIAAATIHAASAMGWSANVGSLEAGKFGDLVATRNSPLQDISELTRPVMVVKGGQVVFEQP